MLVFFIYTWVGSVQGVFVFVWVYLHFVSQKLVETYAATNIPQWFIPPSHFSSLLDLVTLGTINVLLFSTSLAMVVGVLSDFQFPNLFFVGCFLYISLGTKVSRCVCCISIGISYLLATQDYCFIDCYKFFHA